ncbi:MAG: ribulose-phosphate 3-epimerase, partial [Lactobacillus sp.]|jgi:ribulose-phosphate 3-epimerase|nr:ribulose-phosphate 3-epimerase [Lactobacillus sp.]
MDGHFVPNLTYGIPIIKSIRPLTKLPFDVHLMVNNPERMVEWFAEAGADIITVHYEACPNLEETLDQIKHLGKNTGVSLKPQTNPDMLFPFLDKVDLILVMCVEPGFGGQSFMEEQLDKVAVLKEMIGDRDIKIEVDGGINTSNASRCVSAGADILVAGTSVFHGGDYKSNIQTLRQY